MAERLAERPSLGLEFLAGLAIGLPGLGELAARIADLLQPGFPIRDLQPDDAPRNGNPFLAVVGHDFRRIVESALRLAELLREVAHVDETLPIELRPVVEQVYYVRTGSRLDRCGDARLEIV